MEQAQFAGMLVICGGLLISMIAAIAKPIKENTKAMTENTEQIKNLTKNQESYEKHNHDSHQRLWDHSTDQDIKITDHETRISNLEHDKRKERATYENI